MMYSLRGPKKFTPLTEKIYMKLISDIQSKIFFQLLRKKIKKIEEIFQSLKKKGSQGNASSIYYNLKSLWNKNIR